MDKILFILVLFGSLTVLKCQEEEPKEEDVEPTTGNPNYSFSYGVSDANTGDVKSVWEEKEGDTVKGHYSVLEADGTLRTVEYAASPTTGFTAVVNNDGEKFEPQRIGRSSKEPLEEKALRDYGKVFDFSEDADLDHYFNERFKKKHPFDTTFKDYLAKKRPMYPADLESSDFSHSITIKHPRDPTGAGAESESHSHFGLDIDPSCKTKHKHASLNSLYTNVVEFDPRKPQDLKYPLFTPELNGEKLKYEPSNLEYEKLNPYSYGSKLPKLEPADYERLLNPYSIGSKLPKLEDYNFGPSKHKYPYIPDVPLAELYSDNLPLRLKKKYRPHKNPEYQYPSGDIEDFYRPKKKQKTPPRLESDYFPEAEEDELDRPRYPDFEDEERPYRERERDRDVRGTKKEMVRKIVKKRKPAFNLLDILDI